MGVLIRVTVIEYYYFYFYMGHCTLLDAPTLSMVIELWLLHFYYTTTAAFVFLRFLLNLKGINALHYSLMILV